MRGHTASGLNKGWVRKVVEDWPVKDHRKQARPAIARKPRQGSVEALRGVQSVLLIMRGVPLLDACYGINCVVSNKVPAHRI
jgi:hypothetical protein